MIKKSSLKKCIITTLLLIVGLSPLSITNVTAIARPSANSTYTAAPVVADTKEVAITVTKSTPKSIPNGEIGAFFDSLSQTTYYFNDGSYQGILYFSKYFDWKILRGAGQNSFFVITNVEYVGTVTRY